MGWDGGSNDATEWRSVNFGDDVSLLSLKAKVITL